jgi:phosphonate transport system substrate-binding protein
MRFNQAKLDMALSRRRFLASFAAVAAMSVPAHANGSFRFGVTPVFLDNEAEIVELLRDALSSLISRPVEIIQRRTYQEVTGLLLEGSVDAAWLCGYPFMQHRDKLALVAVPVWQGQPLYQSYLIVGSSDTASSLADLKDSVHAFSDPDSNSGYLVTVSDLAREGTTPDIFFSRTVFTYGHRNVVRAVANGLTRSGSVDGYVWEALTKVEPVLAAGTKVISRSELLGFPPICARADRAASSDVLAFKAALLGLSQNEAGRRVLELLQLDEMIPGSPDLFDGIALRMADVSGLR